MKMPMTEKDLRELVIDAMKDRAPMQFEELEESGELKEFIEHRAEEIRESFDTAYEQVRREEWRKAETPTYDVLKHIQALKRGQSVAWEVALEDGLEFLDECSSEVDEEEDVPEWVVESMLEEHDKKGD